MEAGINTTEGWACFDRITAGNWGLSQRRHGGGTPALPRVFRYYVPRGRNSKRYCAFLDTYPKWVPQVDTNYSATMLTQSRPAAIHPPPLSHGSSLEPPDDSHRVDAAFEDRVMPVMQHNTPNHGLAALQKQKVPKPPCAACEETLAAPTPRQGAVDSPLPHIISRDTATPSTPADRIVPDEIRRCRAAHLDASPSSRSYHRQ